MVRVQALKWGGGGGVEKKVRAVSDDSSPLAVQFKFSNMCGWMGGTSPQHILPKGWVVCNLLFEWKKQNKNTFPTPHKNQPTTRSFLIIDPPNNWPPRENKEKNLPKKKSCLQLFFFSKKFSKVVFLKKIKKMLFFFLQKQFVLSSKSN